MKGYLKLIGISTGLFIFFGFIAPRFVAMCPAWVAFNEAQEEYNLHSGAIYYYHVPIVYEAEEVVRAGVAKGMEMRREKALAKENS